MYRVCPRDFTALTRHPWGRATYLYCGSCHGVMLEASEIDKILESGTHPRLPIPDDRPEPDDGTALCSCTGLAMTSISRDGVTAGVCPSCGAMWFDAGELQTVVAERRKEFARSIGAGDPAGYQAPEGGFKAFAIGLFELVGLALEILFSNVVVPPGPRKPRS